MAGTSPHPLHHREGHGLEGGTLGVLQLVDPPGPPAGLMAAVFHQACTSWSAPALFLGIPEAVWLCFPAGESDKENEVGGADRWARRPALWPSLWPESVSEGGNVRNRPGPPLIGGRFQAKHIDGGGTTGAAP